MKKFCCRAASFFSNTASAPAKVFGAHYIFLLLLVLLSHVGECQIKLPRLIGSQAVLQRDTELPLFGWASPLEKIELQLNGKKYFATATDKGTWKITLPAQKAGGPFDLIFTGKNQIVLHDIVFGDVWICSGQSNMELPMERVKYKYPNEISASKNPFIRHFEVPDRYNFKSPMEDFDGGEWKLADPETVLKFSAVAYFFAKEIYAQNGVPIGLINAALGGSPAEAWMSEDALKHFPEQLKEAVRFKDDNLIAQIESNDKMRAKDWYAELDRKDVGLKGQWKSGNLNDHDWSVMSVPGYWADEPIGDIHGAMWFTRTFRVEKNVKDAQNILTLGRIVDQDSVFVNGNFVGTTSYQYPPRIYDLKEDVLRQGVNRITIRVINNSGQGGFVLDKPYVVAMGKDSVNLAGQWKYKVGAEMKSLPGQTFIRWKPVGLYNGMLAPLIKHRIKGVIWYQGESNTSDPAAYRELFPALIKDWRHQWQHEFPFLFVQLANFMDPNAEPMESQWAELREAQRLTQQNVPKTAMAVAIDIGEWNDIHPLNKKDVGIRLALQARKLVYGEKKLIAAGPEPGSAVFSERNVVLTFLNADGLRAKNGKVLRQFSISSDDKIFRWAKTKIEGNNIVVWHDEVKNPTAVRYAWADNPEGANLCNAEGLPATPFQVIKNDR